ncbi:MAG: hypothetical protein M3O36_04030 [Myxococcota bacterium]|nr:hypothetical protein [Myxococcota bacterium]
MADVEKPNEDSPADGSAEELRILWNRFRTGVVVSCPRDKGPLALAVDGAAGVYRFVCTDCGVSSAWFEPGLVGAIRIRGYGTSDH